MRRRALVFALLAPLCWGTTFTLAKPAVEHFPPLLMMLIAYLFVACVTIITVREPIRTPWLRSFVIALCCVTVQGSLLFWSLRKLDASVANLVLQTQVPAAVFLGWLLNGEPLTPRKSFGTAIALLGVVVIIGLPETKPPWLPVALVIMSGTIWALGQVLIRKWSSDPGIVVLKSNALFGVPQLAIATALIETGQWQAVASATGLQWLNLAIVCVFGFYFAYMFWFGALKQMPMDEAAPFVLLMTPIGILTAVVGLGETLTSAQVIGAVILIAGLAIINGIGFPRTRTA